MLLSDQEGGTMLRTRVFSSNVRSVGWENNILEVEFKDGSVYQYLNVPARHFENLLKTRSVGSYIHSRIKSVYRYRQIR